MNWTGYFKTGDRVFRNTLTYTGVEHLTRCLSGEAAQSRVTHLYLRFKTPIPNTPPAEQCTALSFRESDSGGGALYIPLLCAPIESSSTPGRAARNRLQFRFSIPVNDIIADRTNEWASVATDDLHLESGDEIYAIGVVSAQNFNNRNEDILIAASLLDAGEWILVEDTVVPCTYTLTLDF
jgi:hypothetical protein